MLKKEDNILWGRAIITAFLSNIVTVTSLSLLFGNPFIRQLIYTDRAGQSHKAVAVWLEIEPLPAVSPFWDRFLDLDARGLAVQGLLLLWSFGLVLINGKIEYVLAGSILRKGFLFGVGTWGVLWLFFETWVPYNMFGEPFPLMALELALELVAMIATGTTIAFLYRPSIDKR